MPEMKHIGFRADKEIHAELQKEADELYEGNISFVLRKAAKYYLKHTKEQSQKAS